MHGMNNIQLSK